MRSRSGPASWLTVHIRFAGILDAERFVFQGTAYPCINLILYTTGYAENAVVHHGKLDPGVTLVNKPYRRAELLEKVRSTFDDESD